MLFFDLSLISICQLVSYICLNWFFKESPRLTSILLIAHLSYICLSLFVKNVLTLYLSCFLLTFILIWARLPESKYFDLPCSAKAWKSPPLWAGPRFQMSAFHSSNLFLLLLHLLFLHQLLCCTDWLPCTHGLTSDSPAVRAACC